MKFIQGYDRNQIHLFPTSLEAAIHQDNEVRLIDLFVDSLNLQEFGFKTEFGENGRPAYHPSCLLKLFIYGYLNKVRSSRDLEKECKRNIEMMWLMQSLKPDHNTIANFRKDNQRGIRKVFRATVQLATTFDLIGGKLIAGDSTKLRAQNSKKNNFNERKIKRHVEYIDAKLEEYSKLLEQADGDQQPIKQEIQKQRERKAKYEAITKQLNETGEVQVSTSDPDSRQMITRNNITEVAYNIQSTVDAKHNIPIDYKVTNLNDSKAMGPMIRRAKTILKTTDFTALYDKGYHTGSQFRYVDLLDVEVMVAIPKVASHAPHHDYDLKHFRYDEKVDHYICPQGKTLSSNGREYSKGRAAHKQKVKHYKTKECKSCSVYDLCTTSKTNGRVIERSEYTQVIEQNKRRVTQNPEVYRKRQAIVEHPFGVIKRQWGFSYLMTKKGLNRASADIGFIFSAYNLRRIFNLIGKNELKEYFKRVFARFFSFSPRLKAIWAIFSQKVELIVFLKSTLFRAEIAYI